MTRRTPVSPANERTGADVTHFGYREVSVADKAGLVRDVFDSVADRYDLMNDLMSLGVHRLWKRSLIDEVNPRPTDRILDLAGGTGDIARGLKAVMDRRAGNSPSSDIAVCDINAEMLRVGRSKAFDAGLATGFRWVCGDAEALPFADGEFDIVTIAFGLRNVTRIEQALGEAHRLLKPGGRFFCLEFSKVVLPVLDRIYDRYSFSVLPWLGRRVAGNEEAYRYLAESIRRFPDQPKLARMIEAAGFGRSRYRNMTGGVVAVHLGVKV